MTQEERQLLLTDSYARLSYGFKLYRESDDCIITIKPNDISTFAHFLEYSENEDFKLYLRPMSSMTKEEKEKERKLWDIVTKTRNDLHYLYTDFLLSRHIDFRGLIPMGLAIEAPKDMYNIETE